MKTLLLTALLGSFVWGDDIESSITLEGEENSCQVLTIHNALSSMYWGAPRPQSVEIGKHRVIVVEEPEDIPDTFAIVAANGWSTDQDLVTLNEGQEAVVNICPMLGA